MITNSILNRSNFNKIVKWIIQILFGSEYIGLILLISYKYWKLKNKIKKLEKKIDKISIHLDSLVKTQNCENDFKKTILAEPEKRSRSTFRSSSSYKTPPTSPERNEINYKEKSYEILKEMFENYQKNFQEIFRVFFYLKIFIHLFGF